jgi:hypothetical protein
LWQWYAVAAWILAVGLLGLTIADDSVSTPWLALNVGWVLLAVLFTRRALKLR